MTSPLFPFSTSALVSKAKAFAVAQHSSTNHLYDGKPYDTHLQIVVSFAARFLYLLPEGEREAALAAAWCHDTIEDTRVTFNDVKKELGEKVAELVYLCTNEKGRSRKERASEKFYIELATNPTAVFVKLCDRLGNMSYSMSKSSSMSGTYRAEYDMFKKALYTDALAPMWAQLDRLHGCVDFKQLDHQAEALVLNLFTIKPEVVEVAAAALRQTEIKPGHDNAFVAALAAALTHEHVREALRRVLEPAQPPVPAPVEPAPIVTQPEGTSAPVLVTT